nr:putative movement protein [Tomato fruit blotch virus]
MASTDVTAASFDELANILSANYDENGLVRKNLSRAMCCNARTGVLWFTPDDLIARLNGYVSRIYEDTFKVSDPAYQNSYRMYKNLGLLVTPQVGPDVNATLELSLIDSFSVSVLHDNVEPVSVESRDGPTVVCFFPNYSVRNADRCTFNGQQFHRRLGIKYTIDLDDFDISSGDSVSIFTIHAVWQLVHATKPSFFKPSPPVIIPVDVGYVENYLLTKPQKLRSFIQNSIQTSGHQMKSLTSKGAISLLSDKPVLALDAASVEVVPSEKRKKKKKTPRLSVTSEPSISSPPLDLPRATNSIKPIILPPPVIKSS